MLFRPSWRATWVALALCVAIAGTPAAAQPTAAPGGDVTLRIIVTGTADEARRAAARLERGEPFDAVARAVSIDPTADAGGLLGTMPLSALRPELRQAVEALPVGGTSGPVPVPTGVAILKVVPAAEAAVVAASGSGPTAPPAAVAATGSVKYVFTVGGLGESQAALTHYPKPVDWEQDPRTICRLRQESVAAVRTSLEQALSPERASPLPPERRLLAHHALGQLYTYDNRMGEAIRQFEAAYALARNGSDATAADMATQLEEVLGVSYLHKAEIDNGVYHQPGARCLLTPSGLAPFGDPTASRRAIDYFMRYLARRPEELTIRWLLNLAYMTVGEYPRGVPAAHRLPPSALASTEDIGRFTDVAVAAGLDSFSMAGGIVVDDVDGDGRLDVVTSSYDACGPMRLFRRLENGGFAEQGVRAGLGDQLGGLGLVSTDYDNDGCLDLLLLRGGWDVAQRKSLLRNDCAGGFTDVTAASGLARPATSTQAAVWTDIDADGFLDLFIGNEDAPAQLFRNRRDGTFEDIGVRAGIARIGFTKSVAAGDIDNDGWPDLYVGNLNGRGVLYRNNGDRTFTDVTEQAGTPGPGRTFGSWFFDYDNDGWEDLFVTSYFTSVDESVRTYLGLPHAATTLKLYRNRGDGTFADVTAAVGLDKVYMPMGVNFGDVDNDGFLDVYLGTGNPSYASLVPSVLLRNQGGTAFVDVTASSGTGELHKGHGVAFADLDDDGDSDLIFEVGGAVPGDAHALRLFENPGHGNDWLALTLTGVTSNRAAIGARVAVTVEDASGARRTIHRTLGAGGSFGVSPLRLHVGLGRDARRVDVDVWWPTSRTRQRFADVPKNRAFRIQELATSYTPVVLHQQPLGKRRTP